MNMDTWALLVHKRSLTQVRGGTEKLANKCKGYLPFFPTLGWDKIYHFVGTKSAYHIPHIQNGLSLLLTDFQWSTVHSELS